MASAFPRYIGEEINVTVVKEEGKFVEGPPGLHKKKTEDEKEEKDVKLGCEELDIGSFVSKSANQLLRCLVTNSSGHYILKSEVKVVYSLALHPSFRYCPKSMKAFFMDVKIFNQNGVVK